MLIISPYSVRMQENVDQNNSEYEHIFNAVFATVFFELQNGWKYFAVKKIPDTCWKGNIL